MWIAPNVLTFAGFLLLVLQFFLFTYYDNYFYASDDSHTEYAPVPNVLWLIAALCMFWAHQLGMLICRYYMILEYFWKLAKELTLFFFV